MNKNKKTVEIEVDEDAIVGYIVDQNNDELGLIVEDENGEEKEYYYPKPIAPKKKKTRLDEDKEVLQESAQTMKDLYSDGKEVMDGLREMFADIKKDVK